MVFRVLGRLNSLIIHPFVTFHLAIKDLQLIPTVQFRRLQIVLALRDQEAFGLHNASVLCFCGGVGRWVEISTRHCYSGSVLRRSCSHCELGISNVSKSLNKP